MTALESDGLRLDDGTANGRLVLQDAAAEILDIVAPGDALNAIGIPEARDEIVLVIADAADVELVGDLGEAAGATAATVDGSTPTAPDALAAGDMHLDRESPGSACWCWPPPCRS